ncbi:MAG: hypothetical protein ACREL9_11555 [Gemmatimonadales bacterium]
MPPAVEADPLRALVIVPSVSFSSPLSARPIIRGYDAAEGVVRLDGFEILNPFHIGRIFSGFPADATESVAVASAPARSADGGTLGSVVDIRGRTSGEDGGSSRGLSISVLSATGWWGTRGSTPAFAAARAAWLGAATQVAGDGLPYTFQDAYLRAAFGLGGERRTDWSLFAARDELGRLGRGLGVDWSNFLIGQRARLVDTPAGGVDLVASTNRYTLEGTSIPARSSEINVINRFTRWSLGLDAELRRGATTLRGGAALGSRRITNVLSVESGDDFEPTTRQARLAELQAFFGGRWTAGRAMLDLGIRIDASGSAHAWQPRVRFAWSWPGHLTLAVAAAHTARLYQIVTDPQPEPTVAFYDFWFNAGEAGVPVPRVDHLAAELESARAPWSAYVAAFLSRGKGLGELRPVYDQQSGRPPFRYGESRTGGVEFRGTWRPKAPGPAAVLSYIWSQSQRRWEDALWRPWRLDRRHAIRLQLESQIGRRWYVFGAGEFLSGQPMTPVQEVFWSQTPRLPGEQPPPPPLLVNYRFGPEGSARSAPTFHLDLGARARFAGPGNTWILLGLSVINLSFAPVAPEIPVPPEELVRPDGSYPANGVQYKRLFSLPAIPSLTLRVEF